MAQSSKLFVFELKVLQSLEKTRFLPKELGKQLIDDDDYYVMMMMML